jgi:MFS superfamily sulfate permease-like transporter
MRVVTTFFVFLIIGVVGWFVSKNFDAMIGQRITLDLIFAVYENVSLLVVTFWAFMTGVFFALLFSLAVYVRQLSQLSVYRRTIRGLNAEVTGLRNRPIDESKDMFGENPAEKTEVG